MQRIRKKHSKTEIADLLARATALSAEGRLQSEIADQLGISVMTLHRWRKMSEEGDWATPALAPEHHGEQVQASAFALGIGRYAHDDDPEIAALRLENARLRRLVTDLMLEKMQYLEERPRVRARNA
jgi:hypothetical protein